VTTPLTCKALVGATPSYCTELSGDEKSKCLAKAAIEMLDLKICEDAETAEKKAECVTEAFEGIHSKSMESTTFTLNADKCTVLNEPKAKYVCLWLVAATTHDKTACTKILESQYNEACKLIIAAFSDRDTGYSEADKTKWMSSCKAMTIPELKVGCYLSIGHSIETLASQGKDDSEEEKFKKDSIEFYLTGCSQELKNSYDDKLMAAFCIILPLQNLKPEYCAGYSDDAKDSCYQLAAIETGDCSMIKDAEAKDDCNEASLQLYKNAKKKCNKFKGEEFNNCARDYTTTTIMNAVGIKLPDSIVKKSVSLT
jgi:hypothetical protein